MIFDESAQLVSRRAEAVVNNVLLQRWKDDPMQLDYQRYCCFISNLRLWLSPTAYRLKLGLERLRAQLSDRYQAIH